MFALFQFMQYVWKSFLISPMRMSMSPPSMNMKFPWLKLRATLISARSSCACALLTSATLLQSCAATIGTADTSPVAGWRFQIAEKYPSQQRYELFRITPTGEIQYGGGMSAMNDYTTWENALTPEQASEFVELMNSLSWIQTIPKETGDDKTEPVIVVKYQQDGGSERNFAIRGNTPESDKVIAFMKSLTQRRFQSTLQKLPEATENPKKPTASTTPPIVAPTTTPPAVAPNAAPTTTPPSSSTTPRT